MANAKLYSQVLGAVHRPEQFKQVISALSDCKYYAYIIHDHDEGTEPHLHFVAEDRHSLKKWAEHFGLPENMIEIARGFRACNRYLIHLDDPDKYQYAASQIHTNKPIRLEGYLKDNQEYSPLDMYQDLKKVYRKEITTSDFVEKYKFQLNKQSFYGQFKIYSELIKYEF